MEDKLRVSVIGAGSWGSAVAWLLGEKGHQVRLWARSTELVAEFNTRHHNPRYLKDLVFAPNVLATSDLDECLDGTDAVVLATPSAVVAEMGRQLAECLEGRSGGLPDALASGGRSGGLASGGLPSGVRLDVPPAVPPDAVPDGAAGQTPLVLLSKGIEGESGRLLLDVLGESLGHVERLAVLSGPNHAEEVVRGTPAATVVASASTETAQFFQSLFATPAFRVYTSSDAVGVQLNGASKNIVAIACGLAAGLGFGDNTAALLMTRGLAEISRLTVKLGGDPLTCLGLAGVGDLIATCTSPHSRNRAFGLELAAGGTLEAYQQRTHMVVEGALACKTITDLAHAHQVEMPIGMVVRGIVWDGRSIDASLNSLIERTLKPEFY
jgi:glycerol-3-phosphate dehydrogenase (NAD(P)+)